MTPSCEQRQQQQQHQPGAAAAGSEPAASRRCRRAPPHHARMRHRADAALLRCRPPLPPRRRAFYDKRVSQEVDGEALGEVRPPARLRVAVCAVRCCRRHMWAVLPWGQQQPGVAAVVRSSGDAQQRAAVVRSSEQR